MSQRAWSCCPAAELEEVEPSDEAGAALAAQWKGLLAHARALRPLERFRVASVGYRRRAGGAVRWRSTVFRP
jgi:hypothetical protein